MLSVTFTLQDDHFFIQKAFLPHLMADLMSVTPQLEDKNQHSNTLYYK